MKLTRLAGDCGKDDCPAIYATDRGTIVVKGDMFGASFDLTLAVGEEAVEIPAVLLEEALRAAGR